MANIKSAKKRVLVNQTKALRNKMIKSGVKPAVKKVDAAIAAGDYAVASEAYKTAVPVIDRMADKGIIHKNKAARHKSRLNAQVKALAN